MVLELNVNNPYAYSTLQVFSNSSNELTAIDLNITPSEEDRYYEIGLGDTLSNIAYEAYGTSKLWFLIYTANTFLDNPLNLEDSIGKILLIPSQENFYSNNGN